MRIVLIHKFGDKFSEDRLKLLKKLGPYLNYSLLICYEGSDAGTPEQRRQTEDFAGTFFKDVHLHPISAHGDPRCPVGKVILDQYPDGPFLALFTHCTPLRAGWLDDLMAEWESIPKDTLLVSGDGIVMSQYWIYGAGKLGKLPQPVESKLCGHMSWQDSYTVDSATERPMGLPVDALFAKLDFRWSVVTVPGRDDLPELLLNHYNSTTSNVPQHITTMEEPVIDPSILEQGKKVEILIVTHGKDFDWLEYCLKAIRKFAAGFYRVVVAIPDHEFDQKFKDRFGRYGIRVYHYPEIAGKGMIQHEERICTADAICPEADYVMHMDADCIMKEPNHVGHYFRDGKPIWVHLSYDWLTDPLNLPVIRSCYQWKAVTEGALGRKVEQYTMCRHPTVIPRDLYAPFRRHIESVQRKPFRDYVLAQRNEFPQGFAEYPTLGAYFWEFHHDRFHWLDARFDMAPRDLMKVYWSHHGVDGWVGPGWLDGKAVSPEAKQNLTARQEIESWLQ